MSGVPLLEMLRSSLYNWLETILRFIYDSGGFLVPLYIFLMHRLCFAVIRKDMVSSSQRRNYYYEYKQR